MDLDQVKELREKTCVSISQCKDALEEAGGDLSKAVEILRKKGEKVANKKSAREIKSGLVEAYIHGEGKIGVILELGCETDFVAKNDEFKSLAHNLAMHIAAMNPKYIKLEDIPDEVINAEKDIYKEQLKDSGKSEDMINQILGGKIQKYGESISLMSQVFIKDSNCTIEQLLRDKIVKIGENIQIRRFIRYEI
jgi:elongation factor Ts